jgi:hypothetical protein
MPFVRAAQSISVVFAIQKVIGVARKDMKVIVPNVLIARAFVVLASRNAAAAVTLL